MGCFCANRIQNQVISIKNNSYNNDVRKNSVMNSTVAINSGIFVKQKSYDQFMNEYEISIVQGKE